MQNSGYGKYIFGDFRLDADERILFDKKKPIQLTPKVFETLLFLVQNSGRVLSKERLMNEIWEGSFVEENNLAQNISALRRVLRETKTNKFIETVPKFGYRFVAPVQGEIGSDISTDDIDRAPGKILAGMASGNSAASQSGVSELAIITPKTHYVQNGGDINIAYQVVGDGPIDIVFVMGWVSHLEYFWKHHLFASFLNRLASFSRLILFDKRGTGLSDRVPINELPTLEQRMEDVHAVMNAVGSERAVLIGVSEGGPMCALFAATYPELTAALVMIGTYAKRIRDDDYPWAPTEEERAAFFDLLHQDWGKPVGIEERAPSMANDQEFREWWAAYLRMGASPGAAVALTKMNAEIDVRDVLPSVRVPTLVIHRSGDKCLKVEEGRYVASCIPNAKYVELDGTDHLPFVGEQKEILDEIEQFVTDARYAGVYDRVLATVLCIKVASATDEIAGRRKQNAARLPKNASECVRRQLELFRGKQISNEENGVLAVFDGPARAIRCASGIRESVGRLGIKVKIGLHTGECDVLGDVYGGFAVELARRIADEARDSNILVSRTVKDLVAGSGLVFREFGTRSFNALDGKRRLFTVVT